MKAFAYILLFSGRENPQQELSEEASKDLREAMLRLKTPSLKPFRSKLGYNGFLIRWEDEVGIYVKDGIVKIHSYEYGWEELDGCFVDDQGVETKIKEALSNLITDWLPLENI